MPLKAELYDSFARLMYSIAMADGVIEKEERAVLKRAIGEHPLKDSVEKYFESKDNEVYSLVETYKELIEICKENGPDPEYKFFIGVLEELALAAKENDEDSLISSFLANLNDRLLN